METCNVEVGLLRKKPCGSAAVTHCEICEQPLCSQHAIPQVNTLNKKTGKFTCKECEAAGKEQQKGLAAAAKREQEKKALEIQKEAMKPIAEKKPVAYNKPPAAAPAPAAGGAKPEEPKQKPDDSGMIEFTPTKK